MNIPSTIFKSYDIRGIVPDEINKDNIYTITQAILKFIQDKKGKTDVKIVHGRDMRTSSPELSKIMIKALVDGGAHVLDIGLASTPTYYFAVGFLHADGGLELTASHNPGNYNGIKPVMYDGQNILKIGGNTGLNDIRDLALEGVKVTNDGGKVETVENMVQEEVNHALSSLNIAPDDIKPFKVVADPANAMAALYLEEMFSRLPCELIKINFELDGSFPAHQPNPLIFETLVQLQDKIKETGADIGIAPDGDGDRIFFVNNLGEVVPASFTTALIARELLKRQPDSTILYDIRYTMTPKRVIAQFGGRSDVTRVGHAFITQKIHETGAIFGGESSGHYFFKDTGGAESQVPVILIALKALSEYNGTFADLIEELRASYESGEFNFKTDDASSIIEALKESYSDAEISTLDGVSIEYPAWRCNIRTSNTEPLMRLNVEAETHELMNEKLKELQEYITSRGATPHNEH